MSMLPLLRVPSGESDYHNSNAYDLRLAYYLSCTRSQPTWLVALGDGSVPPTTMLSELLKDGACCVMTRPCVEEPWRSADALRAELADAGVLHQFVGLVGHSDVLPKKNRAVAILSAEVAAPIAPAPDGFTVTAIMAVYNESDIVESTIRYLADQGVGTYLIDNWSNDGTYELASALEGQGLIGIERFPESGPTNVFRYAEILGRQQQLASELEADWLIRYDADERRSSPWPGVTLRDALYQVDRLGYSAIDHTQLTFHPVDDAFTIGDELEKHFRHFEFEKADWAFSHVKAWKKTKHQVDLVGHAGHNVLFPGKRVFPYKFLLKHYPVRSQAHGMRKVLQERRARFDPKLRAAGWHVHYDHIDASHRFLRDSSELSVFDDDRFYTDYVVERLTGVGVRRLADENTVDEQTVHRRDESVVILTPDSAEEVARSLVELASDRHPPRVLVIDDGRSGHARAVPAGLETAFIEVPMNTNFVAAVNCGLEAALTDTRNNFFIVLSPGTRRSPRFVVGLEEAAAEAQRTPLVVPVSDARQGQAGSRVGSAIDYIPKARERSAYSFDGHCLLVTRELLNRVGVLDESVFADSREGAVLDLAIRAKQSDCDLLVTERAYMNLASTAQESELHRAECGDAAEAALVSKHGTKWRGLLGPVQSSDTAVADAASAGQEPLDSERLVMTLMLGDDLDLAARCIEFHLQQGVSLVIAPATDLQQETSLAEYISSGSLVLAVVPPKSMGADAVNWLTQLAVTEHSAQMVFHCLPHEFWISRSGHLGRELKASDEDFLAVTVLNVLLSDAGKKTSYVRDASCVVTSPLDADSLPSGENMLLRCVRPRVMFKTEKGALCTDRWAHRLLSPLVRGRKSSDVIALRYPVRDWNSFLADVVHSGEAEDAFVTTADTDLDWDALYASFEKRTLQQDFRALLLSEPHAQQLVYRGTCVKMSEFVTRFADWLPKGLPGASGLR